MPMIHQKQIAECVGLWLAEGDSKCNNEITFTNNQFELIKFFHHNLKNLFSKHTFNIRVYVYAPNSEFVCIPLDVDTVNRYVDIRANKPYYIWRLASVRLNKEWKQIVNEYQSNPALYPEILRGFFAGEGNIKSSSHNSRVIRISQKPCLFLENMLRYFDIDFKYTMHNRSYNITHQDNWRKLATIRIADLHSIKKEKFWSVYSDFKQKHYRNNFLKTNVYITLTKPYLPEQLSNKFHRTKARLQEILVTLKKERRIDNFRVGSKSYWIQKRKNTIIISRLKEKYLEALKTFKSTTELANFFNVCYKASFRRLKELEKLKLRKRKDDKSWHIIETDKKLIVL